MIPASSGGFRRRHLWQTKRPTALYLLHQVDSKDASSPTRSLAKPRSGSTGFSRPRARCFVGSFRGARCVCLWWLWWLCNAGGSTQGGVLLVLPRWSRPWVAPGRPRGHCPAMPSGYAPGRLVSAIISFSYLPLLRPQTLATPAMTDRAKLIDSILWCC
jgi:hypothetical protein